MNKIVEKKKKCRKRYNREEEARRTAGLSLILLESIASLLHTCNVFESVCRYSWFQRVVLDEPKDSLADMYLAKYRSFRSRSVRSFDRTDRDFSAEKITIFSHDRLCRTVCHVDQEEWMYRTGTTTREQETWPSFCSVSFYDSFPCVLFRIARKQEHQRSIRRLSTEIDIAIDGSFTIYVLKRERC